MIIRKGCIKLKGNWVKMKSLLKKYVLYHGTPKSCLKNIINKGFIISTSDTHWMGKGVYFYDDVEKAYAFVSKTRKKVTPVVLKVELEVKSEKILDLVNEEIDKQKFIKFIESQEPVYENSIRLKNVDMNTEKGRDKCIFLLKCALFDYYCFLNEIELVICKHNTHTGSYRQMLMKSISINKDIEIQYCAKTLEIIKSINCV